MKPIEYKFVMDNKGTLTGVELWQGAEHITITMEAEGLHKNGVRWREIKEFLDNIQLPLYKDSKSLPIFSTEESKLDY